ncbi:unnamed protein product, partial [Adineta steineri]
MTDLVDEVQLRTAEEAKTVSAFK